MSVKSEKFCPAPRRFGGLFEAPGRMNTNEPRDPKDVFYKSVELASSFSDHQKLT
jgi:hypothetical protein